MILAMDIGGTKIAAALMQDGAVISEQKLPTPSSGVQKDLTVVLSRLIEPHLSEVEAIAVASTGLIRNGVLTAVNPRNLGGLNEYPLQAELEKLSGKPVLVLNDAQAAAWGEYKALKQPVNNMAFVTVSTGVGAGLVVNGQLLQGDGGFAGHAGHTVIAPSGPKCGCGRQGCVEAVASGTAIGVLGSKVLGRELRSEDVFELFRKGNSQATTVVNDSARAIAELLANMKALLDIDVAVIGGSVGLAEGYLQRIKHYMDLMPSLYRMPLITANLGAQAGIIGAAQLIES